MAAETGISFQAVVKDPSSNLITLSGATVNAKILAPNGCILREENFSGVDINSGYLSLSIAKGTPAGADPSLAFSSVFDNSTARSSLTCINNNGSVNGGLTSYTPAAGDARILRISFVNGADTVVANFNMRASGFAMNSSTLNGLSDSSFVKLGAFLQSQFNNLMTQFNSGTLTANLSGNVTGNVTGNLSGNVTGNVTGNVSGTAANVTGVVAIANGGTGASTAATAINALLPTQTSNTGKVLQTDGTNVSWVTPSSAPVTTVAGRTGAVTLSTSDISGLGNVALITKSGNATDVLKGDGTWSAVSTTDATKLPLAGGTMSGALNMGSQNITNAASVVASTGTFTNAKLFDGGTHYITQAVPTMATDYTVNWPAAIGTTNQILKITGVAGSVATLGWASAGGGGDAFVASPLSQFAATTSSQLAGVLSDETGTGAAVFAGSPTLTGVPVAPTAAVNTNTTQLATTAFVLAQAATTNPVAAGTAAVGTSTTFARADHVHPSELTSGTATGQTMRWNGSAWVPNFLSMTDLRSTVTGAATFSAGCTSSQTLTWTSATDNLGCSNISLPVGQITGTLPAANGGTGQSSFTVGDLLYASTTTALSKLAASTSGYVLTSNGAGAAPSWQAVSTSDSTKLPLAGGTMTGALVNNTNSASTAVAVTQSGAGNAATFMGGYVGIGTTTPANLFSNVSSAATWVNLGDSVATGQSSSSISWNSPNVGYAAAISNSSTSAAANGLQIRTAGTASTNRVLTLGTGVAGNSSNSDVMVVLGNGNVGIGTTAPADKLHIYNSGGETLKIEASTGTSHIFQKFYNTTGRLAIGVEGSSAGTMVTNDTAYSSFISAQNTTDLVFATADTNRMTITSGGNVGIGTVSPNGKLDVTGGSIVGTAASNSSLSIDFSTGNLQYTTSACGALTLNNMKSGATYSLAVQGTAGGTCSIANAYSGSGTTGPLTVKTGSVSLVQSANKHLIITFMVMNTTLYVTAIDGY